MKNTLIATWKIPQIHRVLKAGKSPNLISTNSEVYMIVLKDFKLLCLSYINIILAIRQIILKGNISNSLFTLDSAI